jgi:hypothetical protein
MKYFFASIFLFWTSSASALHLTVNGPCADDLWVDLPVTAQVGTSIGQVSVDVLTKESIPFVGSDQYMASIKETPTGDAALEVISDTEMKSYGWCYSVDGVEPGVYPNELFVATGKESIHWYYGYAHYKEGTWITACAPSYKESPAFLCDP